MKSKSLIGGTFILITANFISKILGAVLKIPLTYILGEEGMAIYHTAFSVYITVLFLTTSGIPFAISKYIASELALSHDGNVKKAVRLSLVLMSFLGILGAAVLFFGADFFSLSMKDPKAVLAIKAIAPSVFFVAVGCVYKSVYEAYTDMIPTAISQVLESFIKLAFGYSFALWLSSFSVMLSTGGAVFAITIGEFLATLILALLFIPYSKSLKPSSESDRYKTVFLSIMSVAVPLIATSVISGSFSLLETSIIRNRLLNITFSPASAERFAKHYSPFTDIFNKIIHTRKMDIDGARWIFGAYSGYAATVFNLPVGILASFGVSVMPVVARCVTTGNFSKIDSILSSVMKIIFILALPCTVIMIIHSEEILTILFKNTASATMLRFLSPMLPVISICNIISVALYASGKIFLPFVNDTISSIIKIIIVYFLIVIPEINILGVIIGAFVSYLLLFVLNFKAAKKHLKISFIPAGFMAKCTVSALCMGIVSLLLKNYFININILGAFIICALASLSVYFILIFLFGVVTKKEIIKLKC